MDGRNEEVSQADANKDGFGNESGRYAECFHCLHYLDAVPWAIVKMTMHEATAFPVISDGGRPRPVLE